jgi:diadenosine tetraphosphatase ApaH/serine/threonine PP2A family protein phosphatase
LSAATIRVLTLQVLRRRLEFIVCAGFERHSRDGRKVRAMMIAILSDIHANRQAFEACLAAARARGAERIVLLGDYVGYGADPEWTVDTVLDLVRAGASAILGNHDRAVRDSSETMNDDAHAAIVWTRGRLTGPQQDFLERLPLTHVEGDVLYVHAEASDPAAWRYVRSADDAARSLAACEARVTFCGHVHRPALYSMSGTGTMTAFVPTADIPVRLLGGRRWLVVLGSVGQPRDGIAAASFGMFDTERQEITFCRAPYDVDAAASRIREKGLPGWLADRLYLGK